MFSIHVNMFIILAFCRLLTLVTSALMIYVLLLTNFCTRGRLSHLLSKLLTYLLMVGSRRDSDGNAKHFFRLTD